MAKNKHLSDQERLQIEGWLRDRVSIKKIAENLGKSTSTISREIKKRAVPSNKSATGRIPNRCTMARSCEKRYLCANKADCVRLCRTCKLCNALCPDFAENICPKLSAPPYVCNGCSDEARCTLRKKHYRQRLAQNNYREILTESRTGVNISEGELLSLDQFMSPLIQNGQSIHHIAVHNPNAFTVSEKSLYRYVSGGLLTARNIDMPRVCRIKPRKTKALEHKVDSACRIGRSYEDFLSFKNQNSDVAVVEMDSVIGRTGGKALLTFMFKSCDFMLAFIRDRNTSQSVIDIWNALYEKLGRKLFYALFLLVVTDNGSEFTNPLALEFDPGGARRSHIFYCDPYSSFQKPNVELNHEFIRRVLPKGYSFDSLAQRDIDLMMSHINSYSREKLNDKSPMELFSFLYGTECLNALGQTKIPANDIVLKPSLLKP
jgi:IS30 family transposase